MFGRSAHRDSCHARSRRALLFGGKKLPELARGSGRALRIFKSEVKDLGDDDEGRVTKPRGPRGG